MGDDYSTMQVYTEQTPPAEARDVLLQVVETRLRDRGFTPVQSGEQFHNRVIAIGPAEHRPWLALYDSSSDPDETGTLLIDYNEFLRLAGGVSAAFGPTVTINMTDSCSLRLDLFARGERVDGYMDRPFLGWEVRPETYVGHPEIWAETLGLKRTTASALRKIWPLEARPSTHSTRILQQTAEILGWNGNFCRTGYSIGADGVPHPYEVPLSCANEAYQEFVECYFARLAPHSQPSCPVKGR